MDNVIFYPSAAIGLVLLTIYFFRCRATKSEFNLSLIANVILQASGIVCGTLLVIGTFYEPAREILKNIDIYILISGLVVVGTSIKSIHKDIFASTKPSPLTPNRQSDKEAGKSATESH